MQEDLFDDKSSLANDLGNGLVLSGNKTSPDPKPDIWHLFTTMC